MEDFERLRIVKIYGKYCWYPSLKIWTSIFKNKNPHFCSSGYTSSLWSISCYVGLCYASHGPIQEVQLPFSHGDPNENRSCGWMLYLPQPAEIHGLGWMWTFPQAKTEKSLKVGLKSNELKMKWFLEGKHWTFWSFIRIYILWWMLVLDFFRRESGNGWLKGLSLGTWKWIMPVFLALGASILFQKRPCHTCLLLNL